MLGDILFDLLGESLLLVARDCSLLDLTSATAALLTRGSVLRVDRGRLAARSAAATARLRHSVAGIALQVGPAALTMALPSCDGRAPALAVLSPHQRGEPAPQAAATSALIRVIEPDTRVAVSEEALRDLFDLTLAEARTARALLAGQEPREIAGQLHVGIGTVRTHLHRIFEKTGIQRQSQLVRLLLAYGTQPSSPFDPTAAQVSGDTVDGHGRDSHRPRAQQVHVIAFVRREGA